MHPREAGKYCGPGKLCSTANKNVEEIQKPPKKDGQWVDGHNTQMENVQGVKHADQFDIMFPVPQEDTLNGF